jgi:hypothetical protein
VPPHECAQIIAPPLQTGRCGFLTDDFSMTPGSVSTMWRTLAPVPLSNPSGSGNFAPCKKKRLTQRGNTAIENIASDALSLGPKPIASAL